MSIHNLKLERLAIQFVILSVAKNLWDPSLRSGWQ